tara:strand:+ start:853 stop:1386 length:534 start_codon:yes stop_codon:yes gene_type:complete
LGSYYLYFKALHIFFVIAWFAGLFYVPRLFIYHIEASKRDNPEKDILTKQLKIMTRRLWYIISWPSAILSILFGILMLTINSTLLGDSWMIAKLFLVLLLIIYHFITHVFFKKLQRNEIEKSSFFMRIWNEVPTLILFIIILLATFKGGLTTLSVIINVISLLALLFVGIKLYQRYR